MKDTCHFRIGPFPAVLMRSQGLFCLFKLQFYNKPGSLIDSAFYGDGPSHQINQPFGNAQSQTGSFDTFCRLFSGERFKYMLQKLFTHSNSRILHGKTVPDS